MTSVGWLSGLNYEKKYLYWPGPGIVYILESEGIVYVTSLGFGDRESRYHMNKF